MFLFNHSKFITIVPFLLSCVLFIPTTFSQTVTNGSLNGSPIGNSRAGNATGWSTCGFSPDLCTTNFPSYVSTSQVASSSSPDGGNWLGLAALGECAQTTITGLTTGNSYTLYFCGACFGTGTSIYNQSPARPIVRVGTSSQTYTIPMTANTWIPLQLSFTATSSTMTLRCEHPNGSIAYASLDGFNLSSPCNTVLLPIELLSFNAFAEIDHYEVLLNWQTAREEGSKSFIIERSTDAVNFKTIGKVAAANYSQAIQEYTFVDDNLPLIGEKKGGLFYYRLQQISLNEEVLYSEVRAVNFPIEELTGFNVYPNPTNHLINVDFVAPTNTTSYVLTIFNMLGQVIQQQSIIPQTGFNHLAIDVQDLEAGTYNIKLSSDNNAHQCRFIKNY